MRPMLLFMKTFSTCPAALFPSARRLRGEPGEDRGGAIMVQQGVSDGDRAFRLELQVQIELEDLILINRIDR